MQNMVLVAGYYTRIENNFFYAVFSLEEPAACDLFATKPLPNTEIILSRFENQGNFQM